MRDEREERGEDRTRGEGDAGEIDETPCLSSTA